MLEMRKGFTMNKYQKTFWKFFLVGVIVGCIIIPFIVTFCGCENPNTIWSNVPDISINKEK